MLLFIMYRVISFASFHSELFENATFPFSINSWVCFCYAIITSVHAVVQGNYFSANHTFDYSHSLSCNLYLKCFIFLQVFQNRKRFCTSRHIYIWQNKVLNESIRLSANLCWLLSLHWLAFKPSIQPKIQQNHLLVRISIFCYVPVVIDGNRQNHNCPLFYRLYLNDILFRNTISINLPSNYFRIEWIQKFPSCSNDRLQTLLAKQSFNLIIHPNFIILKLNLIGTHEEKYSNGQIHFYFTFSAYCDRNQNISNIAPVKCFNFPLELPFHCVKK